MINKKDANDMFTILIGLRIIVIVFHTFKEQNYYLLLLYNMLFGLNYSQILSLISFNQNI